MPLDRFRAETERWLQSSVRQGHSDRTMAEKRRIIGKFFWFAEREHWDFVGTREFDAYLAHVQTGHQEPLGRFGAGKRDPRAYQKVTPNTYRYHYDLLAAVLKWQFEKSGFWTKNPFSPIEPAKVPQNTDVKPFTDRELEALLAASKKGYAPRRDYAIIRLLLDTGLRAAELCNIRIGDIDDNNNVLTVKGKGNKKRLVPIGEKAMKAIWKHVEETSSAFGESSVSPHAHLFCSERGIRAGEALQPRALYDIIKSVAEKAEVADAHPHRFRHTFAIMFLRRNGQQIALMRILGHTTLSMTAHYVALVQADIENQHRQFSPGDRIKG